MTNPDCPNLAEHCPNQDSTRETSDLNAMRPHVDALEHDITALSQFIRKPFTDDAPH